MSFESKYTTTAILNNMIIPVLPAKPTEDEQNTYDSEMEKYQEEQNKVILSEDAFAVGEVIQNLINKLEQVRQRL